jgi:hypothetical protein
VSATAPVRRLAGLRWDAATRRYRRPNGRFLSRDEVLRRLEGEIRAARERFRALGDELRAGRVSLAEFQIRLEGMSKRAILVGAAVERGGFGELSRSDLGWIGQRVRTTLGHVRSLALEIEHGGQPLDGRLLARLEQYAQEHRAAERAMQVRIARADGHTERRRVLGAADHCHRTKRPGCVEQARLGWKAIDDPALVEIGACTCLRNCRCSWAFRGGRAGA